MSTIITWLSNQWRLTVGALGVLAAGGAALWLYLRGKSGAREEALAEQFEAHKQLDTDLAKAEEKTDETIKAIQDAHPGDGGIEQRLLAESKALLDSQAARRRRAGGDGGC
jgi:hypothetical protein